MDTTTYRRSVPLFVAALLYVGQSLVLAQESTPTPKPDLVIASDTTTEFQVPTGGWAPSSVVSCSVWPEIPGAKWIWSSSSVSQQEAMYGSRIVTFRRRFSIPADAKSLSASIQITADNAYELSFNGKLVGRKGTISEGNSHI